MNNSILFLVKNECFGMAVARTVLAFFLASTVVSCVVRHGDVNHRLEGKWYSNKELTLNQPRSSEEGPTPEQVFNLYLRNSGYVFKNNKVGAIAKGDHKYAPTMEEYTVVDSADDSITIKGNKGVGELVITFEGDCFSIMTAYKVKAYFCKE